MPLGRLVDRRLEALQHALRRERAPDGGVAVGALEALDEAGPGPRVEPVGRPEQCRSRNCGDLPAGWVVSAEGTTPSGMRSARTLRHHRA